MSRAPGLVWPDSKSILRISKGDSASDVPIARIRLGALHVGGGTTDACGWLQTKTHLTLILTRNLTCKMPCCLFCNLYS